MSPRQKPLVTVLSVVFGLFATGGLLQATIFAALPSAAEELLRAAEERLGVTKDIDTSFGIARVDVSKDPPEISLGELRSLWKGYWQLSGGQIVINRAKATELSFRQSSAKVKFKVRWVAGNEAVARSAKHSFQMKVIRVDDEIETLVETVDKDVSVGGKGLGGTAFKNGHLVSAALTIDRPAKYRIVFKAANSNTGASLITATVVEFKK
jgi:hypothetical protein